MGLLARTLGIKSLSLEDPATPLMPPSVLFESFNGGRTDSGVSVNEGQAFRLSTVYSCIKVISEDLASLPFAVYERLSNGSVREAFNHPMYSLLHDAPNDRQTAMIFREALIACVLAWGNGYAMIVRDKAARARSLMLLPPDKTKPVVIKDELCYVTTSTVDGQPSIIAGDNMIHVPAISFDGILGISPIRNCMQSVGLAIAAERFGAQFFGNGARATGVFTHPGVLDSDAHEHLKGSVRDWATGDNAMRPIVLEEGLKWEQVTVPPEEAQFLETRKFQRSDIAGMYRVPLHLLQDLERSTNNNIEHQSIEYVRHTLRPLATRLEQECNRKLLSGNFYCEHDLNELTRGDFASQCEGFQVLRNIGVYSTNDIRRRLRENPIAAAQGGDIYLAPLNTTALANLANAPVKPTPEGGAPTPVPGTDEGNSGEPDDPSATVRRGRLPLAA